jgi:hypothetical protein
VDGFLNSLGAVPPASRTFSGLVNPAVGDLVGPGTPLYCEISCSNPLDPTKTITPPTRPGEIAGWGTKMEIVGDLPLFSGQHIWINHDDGVSLELNGSLVPTCPGPTPPGCFTASEAADFPGEEFIYGGPTGLIGFDLIYAEGFSGAAFLQLGLTFDGPPLVSEPEPSTLALLAVAIAGLGGFCNVRRRKLARLGSRLV